MKLLSKIIQENLIQPDDIGQQTDGLFRLIELGTQLSIIEQDTEKKRRIIDNIFALKTTIAKIVKIE